MNNKRRAYVIICMFVLLLVGVTGLPMKNDIDISINGTIETYKMGKLTKKQTKNYFPKAPPKIKASAKKYITVYETSLRPMGIYGLYDTGSMTVYLDKTYSINKSVRYHELGHFFDYTSYKYGPLSKRSEWVKLYKSYSTKGKFRFYSGVYTNSSIFKNSTEFFAECFKYYCYCPNHLKKYNKKIYDYMYKYSNKYVFMRERW